MNDKILSTYYLSFIRYPSVNQSVNPVYLHKNLEEVVIVFELLEYIDSIFLRILLAREVNKHDFVRIRSKFHHFGKVS